MLILSVVVMQLPAFGAEAATTTSSVTVSDFVIDSEGTLNKYNGSSSNVVIPSSVTTIATDAFRDNSTIVSVVIPDTVKTIEPYAFWNCGSLSMVSIGSGLTEIGDFVFANCKSLTSANIPSNIKRIGIYAFEDDINLTDITIPFETMDIHETAFDGCYKLVIHAVEGSYPWKYAQSFYVRQQEFPEYEDVVIYDPEPVVINPNDTDVTDGDTNTGVTDGDSGDGNGSNSGDGETSNDGSGDDQNGSADSADQGDSVIITENVINDLSSVHVVANRAVVFMNSSSPTVYFGNTGANGNGSNGNVVDNSTGDGNGTGSGTGMDENADIPLPEGILPKYTIIDGEIIADQAYYCNDKLSYVTLPETIKEIGQFSYARSSLASIVLPEGLETISYGAFYHCDELGYVTLPQTVEKVEPKAFKYTKWLNDFEAGVSGDGDFLVSGGVLVAYRGSSDVVTLPEDVRIIAAECFKDHEEITTVILPAALESVGEEAFRGCKNLTTVNLDETSAVNVLDRAFFGTGIDQVLLPETLTEMGINAFNDDCVINRNGSNTPVIKHENTAERLSNSDLRLMAYKSKFTEVSVSHGEVGVNVSGEEGVSATLEGATMPYYLYVTRTESAPLIDLAMSRASEIISDRSFSNGVSYDMELTDESGITITKLGHTALTVAIPRPSELADSQLTVLTVDRNGQLEEIKPDIVDVAGNTYVRFSTYHLSPFVIYGTGENLSDEDILTAENVFEFASAPPEIKLSSMEIFKNWLYLKRFRIIPAFALLIGGFVFILYKSKKM